MLFQQQARRVRQAPSGCPTLPRSKCLRQRSHSALEAASRAPNHLVPIPRALTLVYYYCAPPVAEEGHLTQAIKAETGSGSIRQAPHSAGAWKRKRGNGRGARGGRPTASPPRARAKFQVLDATKDPLPGGETSGERGA